MSITLLLRDKVILEDHVDIVITPADILEYMRYRVSVTKEKVTWLTEVIVKVIALMYLRLIYKLVHTTHTCFISIYISVQYRLTSL